MRQFNDSVRLMRSAMVPFGLFPFHPLGSVVDAMSRYASFVSLTHKEPAWNIESCQPLNRRVKVAIETVHETPFMKLLHFAKRDYHAHQPRVLLIAPMSGHFPTLLRETVRTFLPDFDVWVTSWKDAQTIPHENGRFGLNEYIDHVHDSVCHHIGPCHVVAVCQPAPIALIVTAYLAMKGQEDLISSLTLIGGPVDPHNPASDVTNFSLMHSIDWFRRNVITSVPLGYAGAGRQVYPGFMQLSAFIAMDPTRHGNAYKQYFTKLVQGDSEGADKHEEFYKDYLAVTDTCSEFYLETIESLFQKNLLVKGEFFYRETKIDLSAITSTSICTIEGEKDDITSPGQTSSALTMCKKLPDKCKHALLAKNVGHYGVFSGRRFRKEIYPKIAGMILACEKMRKSKVA